MQKLRKDVYEKHIASQSWIAKTFNTKAMQTDIVERIMRQRIFAFPTNYDKDMLQWAINTAFEANDVSALHIYYNTYSHYPDVATNETKQRIRKMFQTIRQNKERTEIHKKWETELQQPLSPSEFDVLFNVYTTVNTETSNYEKWFALETLLRNDKILFNKYNILCKTETPETYLYAWITERATTVQQNQAIKDVANQLKKYNKFNKYLYGKDATVLQTFNAEYIQGNGKFKRD